MKMSSMQSTAPTMKVAFAPSVCVSCVRQHLSLRRCAASRSGVDFVQSSRMPRRQVWCAKVNPSSKSPSSKSPSSKSPSSKSPSSKSPSSKSPSSKSRSSKSPSSKSPSKSSSSKDEVPTPPLKAPKKRMHVPPPASPTPAGDVASAYSLGETLKDSPLLNSTLLNAMRDYFGDDGREVQDYMKRKRNAREEPMFRVVLIGSGPAELEAIQKLKESGVISGLYYCPDEDAVCDIQMSKFGQSAAVSAFYNQDNVVEFAKWIVADAVFVGPDRDGCISKESESALAEAGITLYPHDVTAAIAAGSMSALDCLSPLADDNRETPAEQLLE